MPITTFPTNREIRKLSAAEPAVIFNELLAEAAAWEGGFIVRTPDPVTPTFVENLRAQHYPGLPSFEVNESLEVIDTMEIDGEPYVVTGVSLPLVAG